MTTAILYHGAKGAWTGFCLLGHTGFAEEGEDIVCAGVSALTQTAANALITVAGITPRVRVGQGILAVGLPPRLRGLARHDAQVILRTLYQGLTDIQSAYPGYVRVISR